MSVTLSEGVNNKPSKNLGGRPTLYNTEFNDKAYKLCLLGATDKEMADILNIGESTLNEWKCKHPTFAESITRGKTEADAEIAHSLYQAAKGYEHSEDVIMQFQGQPVIVPTVKHYPPDYRAASLWLRNRRPDQWTDAQQINVNESITINIGELPSLADAKAKLATVRERNVTPEIEAEHSQ